MFKGLRSEVESLVIPVDGDALAEAFALYDRLGARLCDAIGEFDGAGLWKVEGATSLTAWLAARVGMVRRRAAGWASRARKLVQLPVTRRAYVDGVLSAGQVQAICANVDRETVGLFAEHEPEVVPTLVGLSADGVGVVMRRWREHATAEREPAPERPQELHLSRSLDHRWVLDGTLNAETGELLDTALRLASAEEVEGEVPRSNGRRMRWRICAGSSWIISSPGGVAGIART
jgi:hypothetical protein